jgi:hypothetical protein
MVDCGTVCTSKCFTSTLVSSNSLSHTISLRLTTQQTCKSTDHEKILDRNSIYAHEQYFTMSEEFDTIHTESICSTTSKQTTDNRLTCVYVHSTALNHLYFNLEYYQNTHRTKLHSLHFTLAAWCGQSVCYSVSPWRVIFPNSSSPLVHLLVNITHVPHQNSHPPSGML